MTTEQPYDTYSSSDAERARADPGQAVDAIEDGTLGGRTAQIRDEEDSDQPVFEQDLDEEDLSHSRLRWSRCRTDLTSRLHPGASGHAGHGGEECPNAVAKPAGDPAPLVGVVAFRRTRCSLPAWLRKRLPLLRQVTAADQGDEPDEVQDLSLEAPAHLGEQGQQVVGIPGQRHHQSPTRGELVEERTGILGGESVHRDRVIRRAVRQPSTTVGQEHRDIRHAELLENTPCSRRQYWVALDGRHLTGEPAQHG